MPSSITSSGTKAFCGFNGNSSHYSPNGLAVVLFLVALAQRMKDKNLRAGVNGMAVILAIYGIVSIAGLPRL